VEVEGVEPSSENPSIRIRYMLLGVFIEYSATLVSTR